MYTCYPNESARKVIMDIMCKTFILDNQVPILDKVFDLLFKNRIRKELSVVYELLRKILLGLENLGNYFSKYVINRGKQIINKLDNENNMIQDLISFKDDLDDIVKYYFDENECYNDIIRNTFSKFFITNHNKPAQLLTKYIDSKLRGKGISEEDSRF